MKINNKYLTIICSLIFASVLSVNTVFGITDENSQTQENPQTQENAIVLSDTVLDEYNNDIHSVFTVKDCVNVAIKHNPQIRSFIFNEEVYKSKIGQAWAGYFPQLSLGVKFSRTGNHYSNGSYPAYNNGYLNMGYIPNVSGDMLLFDFGKIKASADSAKNMYLAKQEDTKENINTVIYNIKSTYFNILFAEAQVRVYEDTVQDYQLQLDQAWGFYRLGKKAKIDVVTAEYNLGKARLNLVKAKNILEVARVQLSKIMGIPEYTNYELSDELKLNDFDFTVEDALSKAMDVRPELLSALKTAEAAKLTLRAQKRSYTPDLGLFASFSNGLGSDYNLTSSQFGVGMSYDKLNIVKVKKQIDEAKAQYQKSLADYEYIKDNVYLNVKKNYLDLQTAKEQIIIAKLALDEAKEQYRQATGRYKAGIGDAIELKDGENTYLNARLDFYNAMLNYNTSAASLEKEIGVPFEFSPKNILELEDEDKAKD